MVALKIATHAVTGREIVEVFDRRGAFVAAIYPDDDNDGIKIVSKYFADVLHSDGGDSLLAVPDVRIRFEAMP